MAISNRRQSPVKVMLSEDMANKLRVLAEHLGQTPATLASIAVSQYVAQQTVALGATERAMEGFFDRLAPDLLNAIQGTLGTPKNSLLEVIPEEMLQKAAKEPLIGRHTDLFKLSQKGKK